jgi:3-deoxy-manno-octulosonate cytidylyltransferase (CMP-KDO synthetase)
MGLDIKLCSTLELDYHYWNNCSYLLTLLIYFMKILGIIPARYASSRFPGKPLADICGKSMIQRVYEQAKKAQTLSDVVVATDDSRIEDHVLAFGGNVIRTAATHESGTDRSAEVIALTPDFDAVINIQGDEPLINPEQIDLIGHKLKDENVLIATLIKRIHSQDELCNSNTPKVVCGLNGQAIYFSRQTIPHVRAAEESRWLANGTFYKHIGIYGYQTATLKQLAALHPTPLEQTECLEQLRWLEHGYTIHTVETTLETQAVDTPEDLEKIIQSIQKSGL